MASPKRQRQRQNRQARIDARQPVPTVTDADLERLVGPLTVRTDCEHASTRTTSDGIGLTRCAAGASVAGGCPVDCPRFERRDAGGLGLGWHGTAGG